MSKTFHNTTLSITARPRSKRLREAGGYYTAISAGKNRVSNGGQTVIDGGLSDLFEEVLDDNGTVVGIKPVYDLHIIQVAGDEAQGTEDQLKNITELLRLQERVNLGTAASPVYGVKVYGGLLSEGDVVAYGTASGAVIPTAYERLDPASFGQLPEDHTWPAYDSAKAGWILSAALGWNLNARIADLEGERLALGDLSNVETGNPANGQALVYNSTTRKWGPGNVTAGTISSIGLTMPAGFTVTGSPLTVDGTIDVTMASGYVIPTTNQMSLFTPVLTNDAVTGIQANFPMSVAGGVTAAGDVVAYGTASGAASPTAYDRLDPVSGAWPAYDASKAGWILSAALGWELNDRLAAAETGITNLGTRVTALENNSGSGSGSGSGTLSSVGLTMPTGFSVAGSPLTANGTLAVTMASGYVIPTTNQMSLFTPVLTNDVVTGIQANFPMSVAGGVTATGDVVAYGTASGAASPTAYDRLDPASGAWPSYDATKLGYVLSAALGWDLNTRVASLEANSGSGSGSGGGSDHTHPNKLVLDGITEEKVTAWDGAAANSHTHSNRSALDGITTGLISNWNRAYNYYNIAKYDPDGDTLATQNWVDANKQDKLVSGTNIKTINGTSLLGSGNISITGSGSGGDVNVIETVKVNGTALSPDSNKAVNVIVPTKVSDLTNDSGFTANAGTITGIKMNGSTVGSSGVVDLGTVITSLSGYAKTTDLHSHSNKGVLDDITSTKTSHWDTAYTNNHTHSNKSVLDGITSAKVSSWDAAADGSWLPLSGGTLTGALAGTTAAFRTATFGDTSYAGSVTIVRKIGNYPRSAVISIDSSGNVVITPTATGIIICSGIVKASGDVVAYN